MNSDYIIGGRSQLAIHRPNWAGWNTDGSAASQNTTAQTASTASGEKSSGKTAKADSYAEPASSRDVQKTAFNPFNHSGSKKTVGPETDTVDFTFDDFIDIINPLHHIPVVNMIYRELSGDKISGVSQVAGSALFWGPMGIVSGAMNAIFEQEKGASVGETVVASLMGRDTPSSKNAPSPASIPHDKTGTTMLADASDTEGDEALETEEKTVKIAQKQPFGGVMDNGAEQQLAEQDNAVPVANQATNQNASPARPHAPIDDDGRKFYSIAGVPRHMGSPTRMPLSGGDDPRFKSLGKPQPLPPKADIAQLPAAQLPNVHTTKPLTQNNLAQKNNDDALLDALLPSAGLSAPGFVPSASADFALPPSATDGQTPSGNPIPAQLIQDMMMLNMQKYQDGLKTNTLRGASVDVKG